jgi:hypothetical protein
MMIAGHRIHTKLQQFQKQYSHRNSVAVEVHCGWKVTVPQVTRLSKTVAQDVECT